MEKILVLTDFSDIADKGLDTAVRLGEQLGNIEIYLLNTERSPQGRRFSVMADVSKQVEPEEDRYMIELIRVNKKRLLERVQAFERNGVKIQPFLEIGPLQDIVDEFLKKRPVSMVVMGTSGESTFEENFVGNHTEQVVRIADVPVLSVKLSDHSLPFSKIVVATDMDGKAAEGLRHIQALADKLSAEVHMIHVNSNKSDQVRKKLEKYVADYGVANYTISIVEHADTEKGIQQYATKVGADMIAVLTQGHDGLMALLTHSVSEGVIKEASVPVLTVNMNELP